MKRKLCFEKYKKSSILYILAFLACLLLSIAMPEEKRILAVILSLVVFSFAAYYTYAYFSYQKKVENLTPSIGTISNWRVSGHRSSWGCVVLNLNGVEYCSPNYFRTYEAEAMVGKEVSYVIVEDTLLIYDVIY